VCSSGHKFEMNDGSVGPREVRPFNASLSHSGSFDDALRPITNWLIRPKRNSGSDLARNLGLATLIDLDIHNF
jgi:hypothetical protein